MSLDPVLSLFVAFRLAAELGVPVVIGSSAIGLFFSALQAVSQIGDQSLSTGGKLVIVFIIVYFIGKRFGNSIVVFMVNSLNAIGTLQ